MAGRDVTMATGATMLVAVPGGSASNFVWRVPTYYVRHRDWRGRVEVERVEAPTVMARLRAEAAARGCGGASRAARGEVAAWARPAPCKPGRKPPAAASRGTCYGGRS